MPYSAQNLPGVASTSAPHVRARVKILHSATSRHWTLIASIIQTNHSPLKRAVYAAISRFIQYLDGLSICSILKLVTCFFLFGRLLMEMREIRHLAIS